MYRRERKMKGKYALSIVFAFVLLISPSKNLYAETPDLCEQYTGKAKGICIAAIHGARCGETEPSATSLACERLADQFRDATGGEEPPWTPQCPVVCMQAYEDILSIFQSVDPTIVDYKTCGIGTNNVDFWLINISYYVNSYSDVIDLRSIIYPNVPGEGPSAFECGGVSQIESNPYSYWYNSYENIFEQFDSCTEEIESIAASLGLICQ
jgi:hypothetical protein